MYIVVCKLNLFVNRLKLELVEKLNDLANSVQLLKHI